MAPISPNFRFLAAKDPLLHRYGAFAERYFGDDPNTAAGKMRQFAEVLAHSLARAHGLSFTSADDFFAVLRGLDRNLPAEVSDQLHQLRKHGNRALHDHADSHREALALLHVGHRLAGWYHNRYRDPKFTPAPFVLPPNPFAATDALKRDLGAAPAEAAETAAQLAATRGENSSLERLKAEADALAARAFSDLDAALTTRHNANTTSFRRRTREAPGSNGGSGLGPA